MIMGGSAHAKVRNATDLKNDFSVFLIYSIGFFLNDLNLKIRAGRIFAKKNTFKAATNTLDSFQ